MRVDMVPGQSYDLVSNQEMHGHISALNNRMQEFIRQEYVGVKPIRFSSGLKPYAINTQVILSTSGPNAGYIWAIQRVNIYADSGGTTSCVLYRTSDPTSLLPFPNGHKDYVMAFGNGNSQGFGKGQLLVNPGEVLAAFILNTTNAGNAILHGEAIEVPAEMVGKLLI